VELLVKFVAFSSANCCSQPRNSVEALVGSSYSKGRRYLRRRDGKSAVLWEKEKAESIGRGFGSYLCGGYGS